jgi:hemerythrin-like domain-containing protein
VESILEFMRVYGDAFHQEREEAVLFPAMIKASEAGEYERLCLASFEHNRQRSLLEGIEEALMCDRGDDFVYYARRLSELLRIHIKDEDEELFKQADAIVTEADDRRVMNELAHYRAPDSALRCLERIAELEEKCLKGKSLPARPSSQPGGPEGASNSNERSLPGKNVMRQVGTR